MLVKWGQMLRRFFRRPRSIDPGQFTPWPEHGILVGGAIRDALLGRPARDLDWIVPDSEAAATRDAQCSGGSVFPLDRERGHWRVVADGAVRDYIRQVGELEEDLRSRDYTVNAIALERDGTVHDPTHGRRDIARRRLRMVSRENLEDDPLRLLRGGRLASALGFAVSPDTKKAIRTIAAGHLAGSTPRPAVERVQDELNAMLGGPTPARGLLLLDELGLLDVYLPELALARGVDQKGFHHLPVMRHMIEALHQLLHNFPEADLTLRWATLLHDVGKPETRERGEDGRLRFYGHDRLGAEMATKLMRRLRQPEARVKRCAKLIRYHMVQLPRNERQARRFVHRRRELLPDLLKLMIADREAARGPLASEANRRGYRLALARVIEILGEEPPRPPLLTGRDVMELLGIAEGPKVGESVRLITEAEAVGDVETREEAEEALLRYAEAQGWKPS